MQIDWLTVAAQIANFLVLVWLLQRFLYRPINDAMKRREKAIADRLSEAGSAKRDAETEAENLRQSQQQVADARQQVLDDARQQAEALRQRLEQDLRAEMEARRQTWHAHLEQERDDFANTLRRQAGHQVIAITGELLQQYAQNDISGPLANGFLTRIEELDDDLREKLIRAAARTDRPAIVESSAALTPGARGQITRALHKAFDTDIDISYRQDEEVVLGVRLTLGEQTLEWSAAQHLRRLDHMLDEVIDSAAPARSAVPDTQDG